MRLGFDAADVRVRRRIGPPALAEAKGAFGYSQSLTSGGGRFYHALGPLMP